MMLPSRIHRHQCGDGASITFVASITTLRFSITSVMVVSWSFVEHTTTRDLLLHQHRDDEHLDLRR